MRTEGDLRASRDRHLELAAAYRMRCAINSNSQRAAHDQDVSPIGLSRGKRIDRTQVEIALSRDCFSPMLGMKHCHPNSRSIRSRSAADAFGSP